MEFSEAIIVSVVAIFILFCLGKHQEEREEERITLNQAFLSDNTKELINIQKELQSYNISHDYSTTVINFTDNHPEEKWPQLPELKSLIDQVLTQARQDRADLAEILNIQNEMQVQGVLIDYTHEVRNFTRNNKDADEQTNFKLRHIIDQELQQARQDKVNLDDALGHFNRAVSLYGEAKGRIGIEQWGILPSPLLKELEWNRDQIRNQKHLLTHRNWEDYKEKIKIITEDILRIYALAGSAKTIPSVASFHLTAPAYDHIPTRRLLLLLNACTGIPWTLVDLLRGHIMNTDVFNMALRMDEYEYLTDSARKLRDRLKRFDLKNLHELTITSATLGALMDLYCQMRKWQDTVELSEKTLALGQTDKVEIIHRDWLNYLAKLKGEYYSPSAQLQQTDIVRMDKNSSAEEGSRASEVSHHDVQALLKEKEDKQMENSQAGKYLKEMEGKVTMDSEATNAVLRSILTTANQHLIDGRYAKAIDLLQGCLDKYGAPAHDPAMFMVLAQSYLSEATVKAKDDAAIDGYQCLQNAYVYSGQGLAMADDNYDAGNLANLYWVKGNCLFYAAGILEVDDNEDTLLYGRRLINDLILVDMVACFKKIKALTRNYDEECDDIMARISGKIVNIDPVLGYLGESNVFINQQFTVYLDPIELMKTLQEQCDHRNIMERIIIRQVNFVNQLEDLGKKLLADGKIDETTVSIASAYAFGLGCLMTAQKQKALEVFELLRTSDWRAKSLAEAGIMMAEEGLK